MGGVRAIHHLEGQGILDLLPTFALINRWRPVGRVTCAFPTAGSSWRGLLARLLPEITGNSRGTMSRDPHFNQILGVLAGLGAGPEQVSAVAQAYMQRPGAEPAEPAPCPGASVSVCRNSRCFGRRNAGYSVRSR